MIYPYELNDFIPLFVVIIFLFQPKKSPVSRPKYKGTPEPRPAK